MRISSFQNPYIRSLNYTRNFFQYGKESISFGKQAIYAMEIGSNNETPDRFESETKAYSVLGIPISSISAVINGERKATCGYIFTKAKDIEDNDGNINEQKMNIFLRKAKKYSVSSAIYAKKLGSDEQPVRYNCREDAEKDLGFSKIYISEVLYGKAITTNGYIFTKAENIEDQDGNVDEQKMNDFLRKAKKYNIAQAIYAVKTLSDEQPVRYNSRQDAAMDLGFSTDCIQSVLSDKISSSKGYIFAKAKDIEDEDGNVIQENMRNFIVKAKNNDILSAIYVKKIRSSEPPIRYSRREDAVKDLGLSKSGISSVLCGKRSSSNGYIFAKAKDIEDEQGNVNDEKMREFIKTAKKYEILPALYAKKIGSNEQPVRYNFIKEAAMNLGISATNIASVLYGTSNSAGGHIFIKAENIEDDDGNIDEEKMKYFLRAVKKYELSSAFYAKKIGSDEKPVRYIRQADASRDLGIPNPNISAVLNGERNKTCGYIFTKAENIEDLDGNIDEQKMNHFLKTANN